jgi:hypothetical protein
MRPCEFAFPIVLFAWALGIVLRFDHWIGHDIYTVAFLILAGATAGWYIYEEHKLHGRR